MTENERLVLALSSLGVDATNVTSGTAVYDLVARFSQPQSAASSTWWAERQGINGSVFALLALNSRGWSQPYEIVPFTGASAAPAVTVQALIDWILNKEIKKGTADAGGWALSGATPDPDMTAMTLQALAPYHADTTVAAAIDRGVAALSRIQLASGGFASWGTVNAESIAQVIVALTELGIDPAADSRFVKADGNAVTALLQFYVTGGGFKHTLTGSRDGMATDQAGYALVAYDRFVNGQSSLYNMADAFDSGIGNPQAPTASILLEGPGQLAGKANTVFNLLVKADGFPSGDYQLLDGVLSIPEEFSVESVTAGSRLRGGSLTWNDDAADKKLRFVYANTGLDGIGLTGGDLPADLLTVGLRVKADVDTATTPGASIAVDSITLKEASDLPAFVFDVSAASKTVRFADVGISIRELFTGDGIDLIPLGKRAIAVTISGAPAGAKLVYKGTELFYSPEFTAKYAAETYVLFTTPSEPDLDLLNFSNYALPAGTAASVTFGDTDGNGVINAQDALDVISGWLRTTSLTTDAQLLRGNVTGDARVNTFDALGIMEHYVSHKEFAVLKK
jgi:hypothetical protein